MNEWLQALEPRAGARVEGVLVTVASGKGSTPRDAGVKMLVTATGSHGTIGGGELEFQAMGIARDLLARDAGSAAQRFALGADFGQNCGGAAHLVFERVDAETPWVREVARLHRAGTPCVMVMPTGTGSAGRMVVSAASVWGSLAGGAGDADVVAEARRMLGDREHLSKVTGRFAAGPLPNPSPASGRGAPPVRAEDVPITPHQSGTAPDTPLPPRGGGAGGEGAASEDGGLLFDPILPSDFRIVLFGAGHVGKALAHVLGVLSCEVTWADSRAHEFPAQVPANVRVVVTDRPLDLIAEAIPGTFFLTMTHSHASDFAIVEAILSRGDFAYCGMIGSSTKRRSFENGLAKHGVAREALARFTCPIGLAGIDGKEPGAIAIAVAAQLLNVHEASRNARVATTA